jgi:hypothetical protein
LGTDGESIIVSTHRRGDFADIIVERTGATPFTMPGPVYLFAHIKGTIVNPVWVKTETLELTGMDLNFDGASYRLHVSPWWERLVLVAENWLFAAGETTRVAYRPYV